VTTNIQSAIERQREEYGKFPKPLLQLIAEAHGLSIRDFAEVFLISVSYAEDVLKHKVFPCLELAVRIARYWGCTVDDLFAWRIDDTGDRRPLVTKMPGKRNRMLSVHLKEDGVLPVARELAEILKGGE
jgi:transcriptional regulator with XRE-family HTH domain